MWLFLCVVCVLAADMATQLTTVSPHDRRGWFMSMLVGRQAVELNRYEEARHFFSLASSSRASENDCASVQYASLLTPYPRSVSDARVWLSRYESAMSSLLSGDLEVGAMDKEPYVFCVMTAFYHEVYYEADLARTMWLHYAVTARAFPEFVYDPEVSVAPHDSFRLGVVSAHFYPFNSVWSDFGGVLTRLPFEMTYIYLDEQDTGLTPVLEGRSSLMFARSDPNWLWSAREAITSLGLDVLLYLDGTMSKMCRSLSMSRLAPVQAMTHGHPVTSGLPRGTMQYYISWAAAELPWSESRHHYTEELVLLPGDRMHQFYTPRASSGRSLSDGGRFDNITRAYFARFGVTSGVRWYVCMQKPFKRHPSFDWMLARILSSDPGGVLLLHGTPGNVEVWRIMVDRFRSRGMDLSRVHFIPPLPHHVLLGLYSLSDVVLDSYYAGGCTTTREALELGVPVVTLPGRYLGGRWSLAYYSMMGVMDLVASNRSEYVALALRMASDRVERARVRGRILSNVGKLFGRLEAVDAWVHVIEGL